MKNYNLNLYIKEHHPLIWDRWAKFQLDRKREKARLGMRARYIPTGSTPGRPRIEDPRSQSQPAQQ
jgi:hypothetical protein